mmetsp:Transcript_31634/g.78297  ORF Transcript_31634/g.78297 Transcript_31634/m.78297 type:complete len:679 (-) Transcript_31634:409-2445(-)
MTDAEKEEVKARKKAEKKAKKGDGEEKPGKKRKAGDADAEPKAEKKAKGDGDGGAEPRVTRRGSAEKETGLKGDLADDVRGDPSLALSNFRLSPDTLTALRGRGVAALFPIQAATFDMIFDGADLIGRARTGMGKTLAFALPMIELIYKHKREDPATKARGHGPIGLVMAPTRELAQQVGREIETVSPTITLLCVYGGAPMGPQVSSLRSGVDVLVGTPGRIKDHMERETLKLHGVRFATLDEADQMLDMGFADDMSAILGRCTHAERQTCLFSATMPAWVREVAPKYMRPNPKMVDLVGDSAVKASEDVRHIAIPSHWSTRASTINDVIGMYAGASGRAIIFCETKAECDDLITADALKYEAKALHGDIPQQAREKTMASFRAGKTRVLVATDVAARGLDMVVDLVVQSKPPVRKMSGKPEIETYVHRSGRTGRAGKKGTCVTLFGPRDRPILQAIEKATKNTFEWLGAPNPKSLLKTAAETAGTDAAAIAEPVVTLFAKAAKTLLEAKGGDALAAVAAALAVATGTTVMPQTRSLLSNSDGYVTLHAAMNKDVPNTGYVWGALRRVLPEGTTEGTDNVRGMQLTNDGMGAVFDVKEDFLHNLKAVLDKDDWLKACDDQLPPLKEKEFEPRAFGGGRGGGGRGDRGGYGGGGGRGGGCGGRCGGGGWNSAAALASVR